VGRENPLDMCDLVDVVEVVFGIDEKAMMKKKDHMPEMNAVGVFDFGP